MNLKNTGLLKQLAVLTLFVFLVPNAVNGAPARQKKQSSAQCPKTNVSSPATVFAKDSLKFTALVSGGDSGVSPTYNWSISAGTISSGQGTSTIDVDTSGLEDQTVTATVELGGFDRECGYGSTIGSATTSILKKPEAPKANKVGEYGKVTPKAENTQLQEYAIQLQQDPSAQGHIIAYNGRSSLAGESVKSANRAKAYLVGKLGLTPDRVTIVKGGSREKLTVELWLVPSGGQPPAPSPAVKATEAKPKAAATPAKSKKRRK